jgi:hypothetical protein
VFALGPWVDPEVLAVEVSPRSPWFGCLVEFPGEPGPGRIDVAIERPVVENPALRDLRCSVPAFGGVG